MAENGNPTESDIDERDDDLDTGRDDTDGGDGQDDEGDDDVDPKVLKTQLDKVQRKAQRRDAELRKAQARIKELEGKDGQTDEPDPVSIANARIVRTAAKAALAEAGVKREDMSDILPLLNLGGIDVDDEGEVDEDELADRIARLRAAFAPVQSARQRSPRVDTRDRGSRTGATVDPDATRYKNFLGRAS